ncbi:aldehyde ferredoxin oxidoreductase C-terminal domain-containing protein [Candidatus Amarolinea dominans]|uniref:aldehyde ferredoxin oxidoreductase C-terminal domain-containing protein n=1 Tax=Candidatus Amarolinea dominans TaxID=3140696 RepID=UPI0031371F04|nr:hypothetical protein [Anaerolineae bacterium]
MAPAPAPWVTGLNTETLGGFGGLLLNGDLNSIAHINYLCNDYGLTPFHLGGDCLCGRGLRARLLTWLTPMACGSHGETPAIVANVHAIAQRTGCGGDRLAKGVQRLAAALAAPDLDITVKGPEFALP